MTYLMDLVVTCDRRVSELIFTQLTMDRSPLASSLLVLLLFSWCHNRSTFYRWILPFSSAGSDALGALGLFGLSSVPQPRPSLFPPTLRARVLSGFSSVGLCLVPWGPRCNGPQVEKNKERLKLEQGDDTVKDSQIARLIDMERIVSLDGPRCCCLPLCLL